MNEIRVISGESVDLNEDNIRKAFEKDLNNIEEGLIYIASEIEIGTGRIDTLAIDEQLKPVIIEYKKAGEFSKDALIQLMDYLGWFIKDESHIDSLEKFIRKRKPEFQKINREIRLICIVSELDDRVKNACYVIKNPTMLITYTTLKNEKGDILIIPKLELDNSEIERSTIAKEQITEEELIENNPSLKPIYFEIKDYLMSLKDVQWYISNEAARFRIKRVFSVMWFAQKWITLELYLEDGNNPRFKKYKDTWGHIHIQSIKEFDDEVKNKLKIAYNYGKK